MRLYIVRHAIAIPRGTPGIKDEARALTEDGIEKMRRAAEGLSSIGYIPEAIWSSPLVRARQTAEILRDVFGKKIELIISSALAPSADRLDLFGEIANHKSASGSLMLVGHQPSLGEIIGEIAWGSAEHYVDLKKGGLCVIDLENIRGTPRGRLIALLTPSILRQLAGNK
jgi:phosphohistidine phosphatase